MLIALSDYARKYGKDPATARQRALRGAFKTAVKIGRDWLIDDAEPWVDARLRSGEYVNARKKNSEKSQISLDITTLE